MNELTIIKQSVILFGREINYVMLCYVMPAPQGPRKVGARSAPGFLVV